MLQQSVAFEYRPYPDNHPYLADGKMGGLYAWNFDGVDCRPVSLAIASADIAAAEADALLNEDSPSDDNSITCADCGTWTPIGTDGGLEWADSAVDGFAHQLGMRSARTSDQTVLGVLLSDLRLWADRHGVDWSAAVLAADLRYKGHVHAGPKGD